MALKGIPYFPLSCTLDDKFELIEAEFGLTGFAIVVKLFQRIYGGEGYYCEWNSEVALLFGKQSMAGGNVVSEIVNRCVERGLFNQDKFDSYGILTSRGIQERYFEAVKRRKGVEVYLEYLLLDVCNFREDVNILSINADIYSTNASKRKEKKSKEEKTKEDDNAQAREASSNMDPLSNVVSLYTKEIDAVPSTYVIGELNALHDSGMEPEVMLYAIRTAADNNVRKWAYIRAILNSYKKDKILTIEAVNQRERQFQASKDKRRNKRDNRDNFTPDEDLSPDDVGKVRMPRLKNQEGES